MMLIKKEKVIKGIGKEVGWRGSGGYGGVLSESVSAPPTVSLQSGRRDDGQYWS